MRSRPQKGQERNILERELQVQMSLNGNEHSDCLLETEGWGGLRGGGDEVIQVGRGHCIRASQAKVSCWFLF